MKCAIYTATFSDYDILLSPAETTPDSDLIAFGDGIQPFARKWRFEPIHSELKDRNQNEINRYYKLFPSKFLEDYDLSVYVDGNILILSDLTPLIQEFISSGADIALFPSQHNRTVREEIELALARGKVRPERHAAAVQQLADLEAQGHADLQTHMNGVLFRRHHRQELDALMTAWWNDIERYAMRDQFGFPGLIRESGVKVHHWSWQYFHEENAFFHVYPHRDEDPSFFSDLYLALKARSRISLKDEYSWRAMRKTRKALGLSI